MLHHHLSLFLQPLNQATYNTGLSIVDDDFDKVADDKESLLRDLNEEVNVLNMQHHTEDDVEMNISLCHQHSSTRSCQLPWINIF